MTIDSLCFFLFNSSANPFFFSLFCVVYVYLGMENKTWLDGRDVKTTEWYGLSAQPPDECGMMILNSKLRDESCTELNQFVCEKSTIP